MRSISFWLFYAVVSLGLITNAEALAAKWFLYSSAVAAIIEGVNVKSTGEPAGDILTADGADGASWVTPDSANTPSTVVKRDSSGDFVAREIKATPSSSAATGTYGPGFICSQNDTNPCIGYDGTTLGNGVHFKTDFSIRLQATSTAWISAAGSGLAFTGTPTATIGNNNTLYYAHMVTRTRSTTQCGNTAATPTNCFSTTLGSTEWPLDGQTNRFYAQGTFANTASTDKQIQVVLGSTTIFDSGALTAVTADADWKLEGWCIRAAASSVKCSTELKTSNATYPILMDNVTASENTATALTLKLVTNGTNANDVVGDAWRQEFYY